MSRDFKDFETEFWKVRVSFETVTCRHKYNPKVSVTLISRDNKTDGTAFLGDVHSTFTLDIFTNRMNWEKSYFPKDKEGTKYVKDAEIAIGDYARQCLNTKEIWEAVYDKGFAIIKLFQDLYKKKPRAGKLHLSRKETGEHKSITIDFNTLRVRLGRGAWTTVEIKSESDGMTWFYTGTNEDTGEPCQYRLLFFNGKYYNKALFTIYTAWCEKMGRATCESEVIIDTERQVKTVRLTTKVPMKSGANLKIVGA